MPVAFSARAISELNDVVDFYVGCGQAGRFLAAVRTARARIAADPTSLPLDPNSTAVRRIRVAGFPYDLLFKVPPSGPLVVSVWHLHRNPADRPA